MPAIAVLAAAAAAWCFLQVESRHLDALAGGAGPNNGNFLDNDQWLSTVSQYERDKYWNRFRDLVGSGFMGFILPERNFEDNFEGLMLFAPVTCGPGWRLLPRYDREDAGPEAPDAVFPADGIPSVLWEVLPALSEAAPVDGGLFLERGFRTLWMNKRYEALLLLSPPPPDPHPLAP
ncbi:hypothetical protein MJG53_007577 [Ovis ammon polii x Ovis aries]|uniref:Uncharacterized protein n=1 Tax=Ovis ammon polii x Ovis aries TaxID=2918886 RepID=A0ACB9V397_9CETA|nr:hypothetical protein MJG53_007577 [Ovis ammon polii x Ovis aries]